MLKVNTEYTPSDAERRTREGSATLQTPKTQRLFWGGLFAALTLLYLLPLWLFSYMPSLDGPTHLESARALQTLAEGNGVFERFYSPQWRLATNQVYHLLLVTLGGVMPILLAEKVLLSVYVVGFLGALVFALRGLRGAALLAAFLAFPVVYSFVFYIGFYNLCLGLPLFLLALGLFFRLTQSTTSRRGVLLAGALALTLLVLYFVHVIATALTLLALGVMVTLGLFRRSRQAQRTFGLTALAAIPAVLLMVYFVALPPQGTGPETAANTATDFLSVSELLWSFFVHPPEVALKAFVALVVHSWVDVLFTLPWHLLLLLLALLAVRRVIERWSLAHGELLGALVVFWFIVLWTPTRLGEAGWLTERFLPFGYLLLILWLAQADMSPRLWRYAAGVGVVLAGALMAYRIPIHAMLVADIEEYVSAAAVIEDDSVVLPLNLTSRTVPTALSAMVPELRYNPTGQAFGYLALERRLVNLRNYQPAKGYFPLVYKEARNPALFLSKKGYNGLGQRPFAFDLEAYRQRTDSVPDYVLIWGDLKAERRAPDVRNVLTQLSGYNLIHTSEPRGLMHVYKLTP